MELSAIVEELFRSLGLEYNVAKVFYAIMRLGGRATANDIAKSSGLSISTVYRALSELQKLGLIHVTASKPKLYYIPDPDVVVRVVQEHSARLLELAKNISNMIKAVLSSERLESFCTALDSEKDVLHLLEYLIQRSQHELLLFSDNETLGKIKHVVAEACSRIFVHIIASGTTDLMNELLGYGCTVVGLRHYATRVIAISDGIRTLIAPIIQLRIDPHERAIYVENEDVAHIASAYFYHRVHASAISSRYRVDEGRTYSFKSILAAVEFSRIAKSLGFEIEVEIEGYDTITFDKVFLKGYIYDSYAKPRRGMYGLLVIAKDGLYSVGGFRAFTESISASIIRMKPIRFPQVKS